MSEEFEAARRELCPDDACIGLVGPDGRCKVCGTIGRSAVADPRTQGMIRPRDDAGDDDGLDDDRELCPDGACVGVIGPHGTCNVCGTPRDPAAAGAVPAVSRDGAASRATDGLGARDDVAVDVDDEDRELCPDGACIGLVGPDGKCKVCGKSREPTLP